MGIPSLKPDTRQSNWRIVITPPWAPLDAQHGWCREVAASIAGTTAGNVSVECDEQLVCPSCGAEWDTGPDGLNGCCEEEQNAWVAANWEDNPDRVRRLLGVEVFPGPLHCPEPEPIEPLPLSPPPSPSAA